MIDKTWCMNFQKGYSYYLYLRNHTMHDCCDAYLYLGWLSDLNPGDHDLKMLSRRIVDCDNCSSAKETCGHYDDYY